jgi:hypothetical protein
VIFKDSMNFLTGPLSALFDTFELEDVDGIERKPFFPHLFSLDRQLDCLPAAKFYAPHEMKAAAASEFVEWYRANRHQPFLLRSALLEYCVNDVRLLR